VRVSRDGYQSSEVSVELIAGQTNTIATTLKAVAPTLPSPKDASATPRLAGVAAADSIAVDLLSIVAHAQEAESALALLRTVCPRCGQIDTWPGVYSPERTERQAGKQRGSLRDV
jgi:hypothetical protein